MTTEFLCTKAKVFASDGIKIKDSEYRWIFISFNFIQEVNLNDNIRSAKICMDYDDIIYHIHPSHYESFIEIMNKHSVKTIRDKEDG